MFDDFVTCMIMNVHYRSKSKSEVKFQHGGRFSEIVSSNISAVDY